MTNDEKVLAEQSARVSVMVNKNCQLYQNLKFIRLVNLSDFQQYHKIASFKSQIVKKIKNHASKSDHTGRKPMQPEDYLDPAQICTFTSLCTQARVQLPPSCKQNG